MPRLEKDFAHRVRVDRRSEDRYAFDHPDRPYTVEIVFDLDELRNEPSSEPEVAEVRKRQRERLGLRPRPVFRHRVGGIGEIRVRAKRGKALRQPTVAALYGMDADYRAWPSVEELDAYAESLNRYLGERGRASIDWRKVPRKVPDQGRRHDTGFYVEILELFENLKAQGHPRPAAQIAEKYGKPRGTVRSWIARARQMKET